MIFPLAAFLAVEAYLFIYVLIPYLRFDQFQFWDSAGHYFLAWFMRNYTFPNFTGWNPFFYAGNPLDTFYAPLYHYLIALLSFPLELPLAFKLVAAASAAILPFSIYYFARKLKFDPNESAGIILLAMIPVAGLQLACGGTLFSQFIVGLGTNALGLPLFFFYIGKLKEQIDRLREGEIMQVGGPGFVWLTLLAGGILLLHFVATFAAAIAAFILVLNSLNRKVVYFAAKHVLTVFLIGGFFWIPLLAYSGLQANPETILSMGFFLTTPLFLLILLGGAVSRMDKDQRFGRTYFTLLAVFAVALFLDFGQIGLPMHAYRFVPYFMVLAMLLPIKLIFNRIGNIALKRILFIVFLVLFSWQVRIAIFENPRLQTNYNRLFKYNDYKSQMVPYNLKIDLPKVEGRILLLEQSNRLTPRATEHLLARESGNYFLSGLIGDLANAGYIIRMQGKTFNLLSNAETLSKQQPAALWWQTQNAEKLLSIFQVNYILSEVPINNVKLIKKILIRTDRPPYYLYRIGSGKIAEILSYSPLYGDKDWKRMVEQWFESPDRRVLVKAAGLPTTFVSVSDSIEAVERTLFPTRIKLIVRAKENVPILIKEAYFPRWQAYVEGKPARIYEVAPSLMLVYGKGEIKLEYGDTAVDRWGKLITLLGLAALAMAFF